MGVLNGLSVALAVKAAVPIVAKAEKNNRTELANAIASTVVTTGKLAWVAAKVATPNVTEKPIKKNAAAKDDIKAMQQAVSKLGKMVIGAKPSSRLMPFPFNQNLFKVLNLWGIDYNREPTEKEKLAKFEKKNWSTLTKSGKIKAVKDLSRLVAKDLGIKNPIVKFYYEGSKNGLTSKGYQSGNCIYINMKENRNDITSKTIAETVAHECRHVYQVGRANNPITKLDKKFKENLENYISSGVDFMAYKKQLVEVDARKYAKTITSRSN
jgi:hypothetical protein